jgi:hypothetical protein
MATVALSGIITPTNVVTATSTTTLSNKTLVAPALGTPASGVVTNLTGTASININGTVGATTPTTVVATTVKASTTMGVGGATPSASGAGITFPATQSASTDANTLDDYEEGTFTPTINGSPTYSNQTGSYVKIGKLVYVSIFVTWTGGTTSAFQKVNGFPFAIANNQNIPFQCENLVLTAGSQPAFFQSDTNTTTGYLFEQAGGLAPAINFIASDAAASISVYGTYMTT